MGHRLLGRPRACSRVGSARVQVEGIDERDGRNEFEASLFRVTIFRGGDEPWSSWSTATYEVTDADVLEVITWARVRAGMDGLFAIALVVERPWSTGDRAKPSASRSVPTSPASTTRRRHES